VGVASLDAGGLIQLLDLRFATANGNAGHAIGPVGDEGSFIDVIFVYTHGAAHETDPLNISPIHFVWHLPPSNLIVRLQLAIDDLNRSLEGSSVDTRMLRIGDAIEDTEYHESGVMSDDLAAVRNGELNGVHQRREDLAADLVALITSGGVNADNEPLCGLTRTKEEGNTASFNAAQGFLVVASTCLGTTLALAHQFGHDLGTTHDWYSYYATGDTTNVAIQAHGFITKLPPDYPYMGNYRYRSIMALPHYCTQVLGIPKSELNTRCRQTQYWSDWSKTTPIGYGFPPIPNGGPVPEVPFLAVADEVPELNINRVDVSNYRRSVCRALSVC
jgi:hypothetical protein